MARDFYQRICGDEDVGGENLMYAYGMIAEDNDADVSEKAISGPLW
ncbi:hypothetical protein ACFL0G_02290 [Candidatus Zixiibacteriota bacterium]